MNGEIGFLIIFIFYWTKIHIVLNMLWNIPEFAIEMNGFVESYLNDFTIVASCFLSYLGVSASFSRLEFEFKFRILR